MKKWIITVLIGILMAGSAFAQGSSGSDEAARRHLAKMARNETDPAKKAALVNELRSRVTAGADKMLTGHRRRLERAEQGVAKERARLVEREKSKGRRVEKHVQNLLSGKKSRR